MPKCHHVPHWIPSLVHDGERCVNCGRYLLDRDRETGVCRDARSCEVNRLLATQREREWLMEQSNGSSA